MQRCPDSAAAEIERLRADGIEPTLDELARLMHWGALVECPHGRVGPAPEDCPLEVGDRTLWPLTMQAEAWLDYIREWIPSGLHIAAYGLAAERGREPAAFDHLRTRAAAVSAIDRWHATFTGTSAELSRAIGRLVPEIQPSALEPVDDIEAPILPPQFRLDELVADTGLPLEYWQQHTSQHCLRVMAALADKAIRQAGGKGSDPSADAMIQLLTVVAQIRRRAAPSPSKS